MPAEPLLFLNYRRNDTGRDARPLFRELERTLEPGQVFLDQRGLAPGSHWSSEIEAKLDHATAAFIFIGDKWLAAEEPWGKRRIDDPQDWVRREIEWLLKRAATGSVAVTPLLVDVLQVPPAEALPDSLRQLRGLQILKLRQTEYDHDVETLVAFLVERGFRIRTFVEITLNKDMAWAKRCLKEILSIIDDQATDEVTVRSVRFCCVKVCLGLSARDAETIVEFVERGRLDRGATARVVSLTEAVRIGVQDNPLEFLHQRDEEPEEADAPSESAEPGPAGGKSEGHRNPAVDSAPHMEPQPAPTEIIVRAAVAGQTTAIQVLCERFTPALMAMARRYLAGGLGQYYEPADLVQDVWVRVIPRLADIEGLGGRVTPVVMRFLTSTLKNHYNNLLSEHIRGKASAIRADDSEVDQVATTVSDITSRVAHSQEIETLYKALDEMDPLDREVIMLRGLEQMSPDEVATLTGESGSAVESRYSRALKKLVARLPESFLADLD